MTRWHSACLSDVSISILVYRHISLQECQTFCLTVSSSSICIPLLYLGFYHSFNSLFSSACYLITCTSVFAAGLSLHIQAALNLYRQAPSHPPYWGGGAWWLTTSLCFLSIFHQRENESCQPGMYSGRENDENTWQMWNDNSFLIPKHHLIL